METTSLYAPAAPHHDTQVASRDLPASAPATAFFAKPNSAIMTVSPLTKIERLYLNVLLAYAIPKLGTRRQHTIALDEFKDLVRYRYPGHRELKKALISLRKKDVQFGSLDNDFEAWACLGWISEVQVRDGLIIYEFSTTMEQRLADAIQSQFTRLDLLRLAELDSKHAMPLYEMCKRFANVRSTGFKPIEWWYRALTAASPKDDFQFKIFKRDVLTPALSEINSKTDLHVEVETRGRPVAFLRMQIQPRAEALPVPRQCEGQKGEGVASDSLRHTLKNEFGIWDTDIEILLTQSPAELEEGIQYVREQIASGRVTTSVGGYASRTLREYKPVKKPAAVQIELRKARQAQERVSLEQRRQREAEVTRYNIWRQAWLSDYLASLAPQAHRDLEQRFETWLTQNADPVMQSRCRQLGLLSRRPLHPAIVSQLVRLLEEAGLLAIPGPDEYLKSVDSASER